MKCAIFTPLKFEVTANRLETKHLCETEISANKSELEHALRFTYDPNLNASKIVHFVPLKDELNIAKFII